MARRRHRKHFVMTAARKRALRHLIAGNRRRARHRKHR